MKNILVLLSKTRSEQARATSRRVAVPPEIEQKAFDKFSIANGLTVKRTVDNALDCVGSIMVNDYRFRWTWPANNVPAIISLDTQPRDVACFIVATDYRPVMAWKDGCNAVLIFPSEKKAKQHIVDMFAPLEAPESYIPVRVFVTGKDALLGQIDYQYCRFLLEKQGLRLTGAPK